VVMTSKWSPITQRLARKARQGSGVTGRAVEAMVAGCPTSFPDPKEQLVYEWRCRSRTIRSCQRVVRAAVAVLGHDASRDMIVLMGYIRLCRDDEFLRGSGWSPGMHDRDAPVPRSYPLARISKNPLSL